VLVLVLATTGCVYDWESTWKGGPDTGTDQGPGVDLAADMQLDQGPGIDAITSDTQLIDGPRLDGPRDAAADQAPADSKGEAPLPDQALKPDVQPDAKGNDIQIQPDTTPAPDLLPWPIRIESSPGGTASCTDPIEIAVGGGGVCAPGSTIVHSRSTPSTAHEWQIKCSISNAQQTTYAVCLNRYAVGNPVLSPYHYAPSNGSKSLLQTCDIAVPKKTLVTGGCGCDGSALLTGSAPESSNTNRWSCTCTAVTTIWTYGICADSPPPQFEVVPNSGFGPVVTATCTTGKTALGGGCSGASVRSMVPTKTDFSCKAGATDWITAYVICAAY
jgi:hypothetical protein